MGRRRIRAVLSGSVLVLGILGPSAAAAPVGQQSYIVVLESGSDDVAATAAQLARANGAQLGFVYEHALQGFSIRANPAAAAALGRSPLVAYVEPDLVVSIAAQTTPTGIERIFADENPNLTIDGSDDLRIDVDVAVIDTGIDLDHPDLDVVASTNCSGGSPFRSSCGTGGDDDHGHGTHVAGTIGAVDDDQGVVGVAPGARMWAVKVLRSDGSGYLSWIIAGIDWVTARADQIEVANMSLGGAFSSSAFDDALANSVDAGVAYAVAAGNDDSDAAGFSPANHPDVLTVSALADFDGDPGGLGSPTCRDDQDDTLADFSNWGSLVEITAPGVCILSTWLNGGYNTISGTSMASPHAAGALALLASGSGDPTNETQVKAHYQTLIDNGNFNWTDDSGDGTKEPLLDVGNASVFDPATVAGSGGGEPANDPPTVAITNPADGATVAGTVTITADASDSDGDVAQVEFFVDSVGIGVDSTPSDGWSIEWDSKTVGEGDHPISATATDGQGATGSDSINVTVDNIDDLPVVTITNPADGSTVSGVVTVTADATDDNGVGQVEFFVDIVSIGVDSDGSNGWSVNWDTTGLADGSPHVIDAVATDTASQTGSDSVTVTVDNSSVTIHVGDLDGVSINQGSSWQAEVTITIHDSSHNAMAGVTVSGTWTVNGTSSSASCVTGSDGQCTVSGAGIHKRFGQTTFTVDDLTGSNVTYDPAANHDPDGDSNGTSIVVTKP